LHEGIPKEKVFMVGNTVVDAVFQNLEIAKSSMQILNQLNIQAYRYVLVTSHRQENVDDRNRFANMIRGLQLVQNELQVPIIYPIHPRAKKQLSLFGIDASGLTLVEPLDYLAFLQLESKAKLVLTDSGGVQEETCILKVPCVTLRDNTERPETLEVGANMLAGTDPDKILEATKTMVNVKRDWVNPFGDGTSSQKIVKILLDKLN